VQAGTEVAKKAYGAGEYKTAFNEYLAAAKKGDATAQGWVGLLYKRGEGIYKNYTEAANWYGQAAEQGHAMGQCNFGLMYAQRKSLKKDAVKAYM